MTSMLFWYEREAEIIAQAGRPGAVTIATNMAGRGVDIMPGGNPPVPEDAKKVRDMGGVFVLGTERHESRRIDNQLRGRSARQGDPGATHFYLSMEDDLMRIFGSDRTRSIMDRLGIPEDMPIENRMVTGAIEKAQKRVESHHFDTRKHLLEYDDVLNKHREVVYGRRREVLEAYASEDKTLLKQRVLEIIEGEVEQVVMMHLEGNTAPAGGTTSVSDETRKLEEMINTIVPLSQAQQEQILAVTASVTKDKQLVAQERTKVIEDIMAIIKNAYDEHEQKLGGRDEMREIERLVILRAMDSLWIDHLAAMTALRTGIGLRGYGQQDPLIEYKREAFGMFQHLLSAINQEITFTFFKYAKNSIDRRARQSDVMSGLLSKTGLSLSGALKTATAALSLVTQAIGDGKSDASATDGEHKVGRNDPCYCGSGKKYKKCHGA